MRAQRNNKYVDWMFGIYLSSIPEVFIGMVILGFSPKHSIGQIIGIVFVCLALPSIVVGLYLSDKDKKLNEEFDKEESDRKQYEEYKRLKDKYEDKMVNK